MQNRNKFLLTPAFTLFHYGSTNYTTGQYFTYGSYGSDNFTFSGFGSNDKRKKQVPTNGTYTVFKHKPLVCVTDCYFTNDGSDAPGRPSRLAKGSFCETAVPSALGNYVPAANTAARNRAIDKLYDQLTNSDINLAVSLGELRETRRMLSNALTSMGNMIQFTRKLRRDFRENPARTLRRLRVKFTKSDLVHRPSLLFSRAWLQAKYGWMPAVNDCYALVQHTAHAYRDREFKARSRIQEPINTYWGLFNVYPGNRYMKQHVEGFRWSQYEFKVIATVRNDLSFSFSRISTLNPVSIAWELTPLSFVVDWFYNIGSYLEAQERALGLGLVFHDGYETTVHGVDIKGSLYDGGNGKGYAQGYRYYVVKTRTRLSNFPKPTLPIFKAKLGAQRIMSATALFRTIALGKI